MATLKEVENFLKQNTKFYFKIIDSSDISAVIFIFFGVTKEKDKKKLEALISEIKQSFVADWVNIQIGFCEDNLNRLL
jgi:hypothetical protein